MPVTHVDANSCSSDTLRVSLPTVVKSSLLHIRQLLGQFGYRMKTFSARNIDEIKSNDIEGIIVLMSLNDLNRVLCRCDGEEQADGKGWGAYGLSNYGGMTYSGLQGELPQSYLPSVASGIVTSTCRGLWGVSYSYHLVCFTVGSMTCLLQTSQFCGKSNIYNLFIYNNCLEFLSYKSS